MAPWGRGQRERCSPGLDSERAWLTQDIVEEEADWPQVWARATLVRFMSFSLERDSEHALSTGFGVQILADLYKGEGPCSRQFISQEFINFSFHLSVSFHFEKLKNYLPVKQVLWEGMPSIMQSTVLGQNPRNNESLHHLGKWLNKMGSFCTVEYYEALRWKTVYQLAWRYF